MNFADRVNKFLHESSMGYIERGLRGFKAVDRDLSSLDLGSFTTGDKKDQITEQVKNRKRTRDYLFEQIDVVKDHHIAKTIKDVIIDDCFSAFCDNNLINIKYRGSDEETNNLFNTTIEDLLSSTSFLNVFKDCLINEGMDYGEMFLSTECVVGEGIIEINDDIGIKNHIAIYKNLNPIGFLKLNEYDNCSEPVYIEPNKISHFLINYKKIPLKINYAHNKNYEIPEKIRCAEPILTPVIDLIIQYNMLEQTRTAIEVNKAIAPLLLGIGVNSATNMTEARAQLQEYSVGINQTRNSILNNLNNLNVQNILSNTNVLKLIPYDAESGTNAIQQIKIQHPNNNLTVILNDLKRAMAKAVGIPEPCLASSDHPMDKSDSIITDPRYSRMLSSIQQSLIIGMVEFIYKHLKYRFSKYDVNGKMVLERKIDKNKIDVRIKSLTNVDDRLDMEQMLLLANSVSEIVGVIDSISGSPNLPLKTNFHKVKKFWETTMSKYPDLKDVFEEDLTVSNNTDNLEQDEYEDQEDDNIENDEIEDTGDTINPKKEEDIRDIFK